MTMTSTQDLLAQLYARDSRLILATLTRLLGDLDLAEEALQDAFQTAATQWPTDGIPKNPRSWLVSTGRFKAIDSLRRQTRGKELIERHVEGHQTPQPEDWTADIFHDDQLRLIFTCCHPSLPTHARIALSLRIICGLTTEEIARAFHVPSETMKKRITRAKSHIREHQIPYEIPSRNDLEERVQTVLHVIYLVYNEGFCATSGTEHIRLPLTQQALLLARLVAHLLPTPESTGLLALLLFHESRAAARVTHEGDIIPLEEQDRTLWDTHLINEGFSLVLRSATSGGMGPFAIQAAIASVHASADSATSTNWNVIVTYYDALLTLQPSPIIELHRAIAISMRDDADTGLRLVERLLANHDSMANYHLTHATHAHLLQRMNHLEEARHAYQRALKLARQAPEKRYLEQRLARLS